MAARASAPAGPMFLRLARSAQKLPSLPLACTLAFGAPVALAQPSPDQAVEAYSLYLKSDPVDMHSLRRLATAYRQLNRPDDERATLKLADALDARTAKAR